MSQSAWSVMPANAAIHDPVLAHEVVALLDVQPGMTVVDGTFGAGGHATMLAELMQGRGAYVAIDRDPSVENRARSFRASHPDMAVRLLKRDFVDAFRSLAIENVEADAILLDLGVSSMQIDQPERGFSYAVDAPLDMRMDPRGGDTAADLLANLSERELADMFSRYGAPDRSRHLPPPHVAALRAQRRPRRHDPPRDSDARAVRLGASCQARLPGTPHRRQRRACDGRRRPRCSNADPQARRPHRGHLVPFARRSNRQRAVP